MSVQAVSQDSLELSGLDGANPLGFLAALGTLVTACAAGESRVCLRWARSRTWVAVLEGLSEPDKPTLCEALARALQGKAVSADAEEKRGAAEKAYKEASKAVDKAMKHIKDQALRGEARKAEIKARVEPLEAESGSKRTAWLLALRDAVPRPELALGKKLDCTDKEYRAHAATFITQPRAAAGEALDLLATFGSDACLLKDSEEIQATPFYFTKGSGGQSFLETARLLIEKATAERVRQALFDTWTYRDEKLSMRWDPLEDARYALNHSKPADEGTATVWMANLLAYRGLAMFPSAPTRHGLGTTGWTEPIDGEPFMTWPIWESPLAPDTIRSLLQLDELTAPRPDRTVLHARGVAATFRARRIRVPPQGSNYKLNFSPARRV